MALVQNAQDVPVFSGGSIDPKARRSVTRTRSQHGILEAKDPNVSIDPPQTPPANQTAAVSLTEVKAICKSSKDLYDGKLQKVLDLAENNYKHTLEKAEIIMPRTYADPSPVYQHHVYADRFPALHSLHIAGLFPSAATMRTFRHLRHLRLYSLYRKLYGNLMSLNDFINVLGTWTQLEELELRGYFPALSFKQGDAQPPIVPLPNLRKLTVADVPQFFAVLLPCLRLQPTAEVHLISQHHHPAYPATYNDIFWPFTFNGRGNKFPVLNEVVEVAITTANPEEGTEDYALRIIGHGARGGSFTLDIRSAASFSPAPDSEFRRSAVDWALQAAPILFPSGARMRTLRCTANLRMVQEKSWIPVFLGYPALEELVVDGGVTADLGRLFAALGGPVRETNVVCQRLRRVAVRDALYTPKFMDQVARCFHQRQYNSNRAAARTALQLGLLVCDYPYPPEHQGLHVAKLKELGVDAEIFVESPWDFMRVLSKYLPPDEES
ncbi:hypothetical protein GSI_06132 [Ganoderma sinense ZZ0214-1]|uniref:Uncharacterized protein n=1 Tax=Ganoderma sinense ZZ0214-1 TaxID=1077348 RepID=A0A2G8SCF7_9APHY|nr:hypothetical protein GSI_06132 [Ganoderma sinense ZZ0214-1]